MVRIGKLEPAFLERMFRYRGQPDRRVRLGPAVGEDAAAINLGNSYLILKTDPITYATDAIGWYAVHINANDIATKGAEPTWFQASILLPPRTSKRQIERIFRQISRACKELGVAVTGGHSEVTPGLPRPIIVGDMHGLVAKDDLVTSGGARVRDAIVLTKGAAIEGTAVLAREKAKELRKTLPAHVIRRARNFLYRPGLSVVREARVASQLGCTAMHDPTEGGVAMGLWELAEASRKGLLVWPDRIPIAKETQRICAHFGIDPLGLLGSGALLITIRESAVPTLIARLKRRGIQAAQIGRVKRRQYGLRLSRGGVLGPLRASEKDELLKVL